MSQARLAQLVPHAIRYSRSSRMLSLAFAQEAGVRGGEVRLSAEYLRVESPSAESRGHVGLASGAVGQQTYARVVPFAKKYVQITHIEPVGNYAIRLVFSDGHESGIYSFDLLGELATSKWPRMRAYIRALRAARRSRVPRSSAAAL